MASESVSLAALTRLYDRHWDIFDSAAGGWIAVRRHGVSQRALDRGLSNVRCGDTLEELGRRLHAEAQIEQHAVALAGHASSRERTPNQK